MTKSQAMKHFRVGKATLADYIERGAISQTPTTDQSGRPVKHLPIAQLEAHFKRKVSTPVTHDRLEERVGQLRDAVDDLRGELVELETELRPMLDWIAKQAALESRPLSESSARIVRRLGVCVHLVLRRATHGIQLGT